MSQQLTINAPEAAVLNKSAEAFLASAQSMVIDSDAMYQLAGDELKAIKTKASDLEAQRRNLVDPLNKVVKDLNDLFRAPAQFLANAESTVKRAMLTYQDKRERERREAEARARAEAEAAAAKERARIEQERAAAEEKARIEQERIEAERQAALTAGDTVKAAKLEEKAVGVAEAAEAKVAGLQEVAATVAAAPVVTMPEAPKVAGVSTRGVWKCECTDKHALIKFVAENPQFLELVEFNEKAGSQMAKALKANMKIDGLRVFEEKVLSSKKAA